MEYFYSPVPPGDGRCSDNKCPCPEVVIPRGLGYLYIDDALVAFRSQHRSEGDAERAMREALAHSGGGIRGGFFRTGPILVCEQGARLRGLDLNVAGADAARWWHSGEVPLRATPLATPREPLAPGDSPSSGASLSAGEEKRALSTASLQELILGGLQGEVVPSLAQEVSQVLAKELMARLGAIQLTPADVSSLADQALSALRGVLESSPDQWPEGGLPGIATRIARDFSPTQAATPTGAAREEAMAGKEIAFAAFGCLWLLSFPLGLLAIWWKPYGNMHWETKALLSVALMMALVMINKVAGFTEPVKR